jgi:hypothetical protein
MSLMLLCLAKPANRACIYLHSSVHNQVQQQTATAEDAAAAVKKARRMLANLWCSCKFCCNGTVAAMHYACLTAAGSAACRRSWP